ncbi:MAG: CHAT domain-containing protein [Blastocatellia bacterium]|nr:CHAT domain-containing protein [Blastocatellia bacterium]
MMIRRTKHAMVRSLTYGCLTALAVMLIAAVSAQEQTEIAALSNDANVNGRLKKGETHRYRLALSAGEYVHVEAKALSGDITLELTTRDGKKLMKTKARQGFPEGNSVAAVADEAANYYVRIAAMDPQKDDAEYMVRMSDLRPATTTDRARCQGEHLFAAGEEIYDRRTKDSYLAAIVKYQAALPYFQEAKDWFGAAQAVETMGEAYVYLGNYSEALSAFEAAVPLIQKAQQETKVLSLAAKTMNNIGYIYDQQYNKQKALSHYLQAANFYRRLGNQRSEAICIANIGGIYTTTGQPEEALKWYAQALSTQKGLDNKVQQANLFYSRAAALYFMNKFDEAIKENQEGLDIWESVGNSGKQGFGLTALASNYLELNQPQTALELLGKAMPLIQKGGNQRDEALALHFFGDAWRLSGQPTKALVYYQQAQDLRKNMGERILEAFTISKIARAEMLRENFSEALFQSARALDIVESVRRGHANFILGASYSSSTHHYYAEHIALLLQLHKKQPGGGYDIQAFQTSERAHARALLEILTDLDNDIRSVASPELLQREADLQKNLDQKVGDRDKLRRSTSGSAQTEKLAGIEHELRQIMAELDQVQGQLRASHPRYAALLRPQPLSPVEIQQQVLSTDAVLLEYFIAADRIYLFAVTKQDPLQVVEISDKATVEQAAVFFKRRKFENDREFEERLSYDNEEFQESIQLLSDKLLKPVKSLLTKRKIWIVSDGALQQIPFAVLPDPNGAASLAKTKRSRAGRSTRSIPPLIVAHELATLPSASTVAWLQKVTANRPQAQGIIAVFADPVFSANDERVRTSAPRQETLAPAIAKQFKLAPDLEEASRDLRGDADPVALKRLPASRDEALAIADLVPAEKRLIALDFDASREKVLSGAVSQFRYLHFATHARVDDQYPQLSWLALSLVDRQGREQHGRLWLNDIYRLRLGADLVVLGACRTGLGKQLRGEGMIGMSRSFIYAGAPRVLVSLWAVPDRETAQLMELFYHNLLKRRLPVNEALRQAQVEMWKQPKSKAPYFWAAFALQGDPE